MPTRRTTSPAALVVDFSDLKAHLRVTDGAEDLVIRAALDTAIAEIDGPGLLGRAMVAATYLQTSPAQALRRGAVEIGPVISIEAVEVIRPDGARVSLDPAGFDLENDGERAILSGAWGSLAARSDAIAITHRAGFGETADAVPPDLRHAVKLLAAHRYEVREEVVIGTTAAQIPIGVSRLIDLSRVRFFG